MALVLLGLGAYGYLRIGADLEASVDAGLRSRAQVLVDAASSSQAAEVVAANGKLGGFSGGLDWKRRLLALESPSIFVFG